MRFNPDATVWVAKQRILCTLNQSLKDVLNYGLFQPASNGRDGKFLDEERILREYPQPISKGVPSLEVSPLFVRLAVMMLCKLSYMESNLNLLQQQQVRLSAHQQTKLDFLSSNWPQVVSTQLQLASVSIS